MLRRLRDEPAVALHDLFRACGCDCANDTCACPGLPRESADSAAQTPTIHVSSNQRGRMRRETGMRAGGKRGLTENCKTQVCMLWAHLVLTRVGVVRIQPLGPAAIVVLITRTSHAAVCTSLSLARLDFLAGNWLNRHMKQFFRTSLRRVLQANPLQAEQREVSPLRRSAERTSEADGSLHMKRDICLVGCGCM